MLSTVHAVYTNVACRHSFRNSAAKEKKFRTRCCALAWVQMYLFQTDALVIDIVSPRKWSRDCLFFDWDSLSEIPSSMGRKELKVEHVSATVLTVSVRECLFQVFPVQVDLVKGGNAFHCIVFVALF